MKKQKIITMRNTKLKTKTTMMKMIMMPKSLHQILMSQSGSKKISWQA